jgi:hypothetical protein
MKRLVLTALTLALVVPAFAVPALADPTDPVVQLVRAPARGVIVVPTVTVWGRPNRPMVQILIRTPSAADAAGAAHERLRTTALARSEPGAVKPAP